MRARALAAPWLALGALVCTTGVARAADEEPTPVRTEAPCSVPRFDGKLVSEVWPADCDGGSCVTPRALTLENAEGQAVFGVDGLTAIGGPPALECKDGFVVLSYEGEALHFEFHAGRLRLSLADSRRIAGLWAAPEARTRSGIVSHANLALTLSLVQNGLRGRDLPRPTGVEDEIADLTLLVSIRDQIRAGRFQPAEEILSLVETSRVQSRPHRLSPRVATHVVELRHELDQARRRTLPFSLGPRRFVGGAERVLRTPLDAGGPPELFFRGAELCVVAVAPAHDEPAVEPAWPEDAMHCFAPAATSSRGSEPRALPRSSTAELARVAGVDVKDLLAVVEGEALLVVARGELVLVRGPTVTETVSPARARELVAGSEGTRLVTRTASYFADSRHIAQIAGERAKTWDVFDKPPDGVAWVGTPLVSPDQRWVVAQSGDGAHAVSLWVFPIR